EHVPSYVSVCVYFDAERLAASPESGADAAFPFAAVVARLRRLLRTANAKADPPGRTEADADAVRIPVCYCDACGPDLAALAAARGMTSAQASRLHAEAAYTVAMIGFLPGFPYMTGLPEPLAAPRLDTPRTAVPAGSVG